MGLSGSERDRPAGPIMGIGQTPFAGLDLYAAAKYIYRRP
jgi:hypothetical protein